MFQDASGVFSPTVCILFQPKWDVHQRMNSAASHEARREMDMRILGFSELAFHKIKVLLGHTHPWANIIPLELQGLYEWW